MPPIGPEEAERSTRFPDVTLPRRTVMTAVLTTTLTATLTSTLAGALVVATARVAEADPRSAPRPSPRWNRGLGYPSTAVYPAADLFPVR